MKRAICFYLFISLGICVWAQEPQISLEKEGVLFPEINSQSLLGKLGLQTKDQLLSYAEIPVANKGIVLQIEAFLTLLETRWEQTGKKEDFWQKHEKSIRKKTNGTFLRPVAFKKEQSQIIPLYNLIIKRKISKEEKILKFRVPANKLRYLFMNEVAKKNYVDTLHTKGLEAYQKNQFTKASLYIKETIEVLRELPDLEFLAINLALLGTISVSLKHTEEAILYYQEAIQIREKLGLMLSCSITINNLAHLYFNLELYQQSLPYYQRSLKIMKQLKREPEIAMLLGNIAGNYKMQGNYNKALDYYQRSLILLKKLKNLASISSALTNIGECYLHQSKYKLAKESLQESLRLSQESKQIKQERENFILLGDTAKEEQEFELSLSYYQKVLPLYKKEGNWNEYLNLLNKIGHLYRKSLAYEKAKQTFQIALTMQQKLKLEKEKAITLGSLGTLYFDLEDFYKSETLHQEAKQILEKLGARSHLMNCLSNLGKLKIKLAKYQEAIQLYQQNYQIAERLGMPISLANALRSQGTAYFHLGEHQKATVLLKRALKFYQQNNLELEATYASSVLGAILIKQGNDQTVQASFEKGLLISRKYKDLNLEILLLTGLGEIYLKQGLLQKSLESSLEVLSKLNPNYSKSKQASLWNNIGFIYFKQGNLNKTEEFYEKALQIRKQLNLKSEIANSLINIGELAQQKGETTKSLSCFFRAIELLKVTGQKAILASTYAKIGKAFLNLNQHKNALIYLEKSYNLFDELNLYLLKVTSGCYLGDYYLSLGELEKAREKYEIGVQAFSKSKTKEALASCFVSLAKIEEKLNHFEKAKHYLQEALILNLQVEDKLNEANIRTSLAISNARQGNYEEAFQGLTIASQIAKEIKIVSLQIYVFNAIGYLYQELGNFEDSLNHLQKSLTLMETSGNTQSLSSILNQIACIYLKLGNHEKSLSFFQRAIKLDQELGQKFKIATNYQNIGFIYHTLNQQQKALEYYLKGYKILKEADKRFDYAFILLNVSALDLGKGNYQLSTHLVSDALKIVEELGSPKEIIQATFSLANHYYKINNKEKGRLYLLRGIKRFEKLLQKTGSNRVTFIKEQLFYYKGAIEFFLQEEPKIAFELLQKIKGFQFLTQLAQIRYEIEGKLDSSMLRERKQLESEIAFIQKQILTLTSGQKISAVSLNNLKTKLQKKEEALEFWIKKIRFENFSIANIDYPQAVSLEKFGEILPRDTLFLEFFSLKDDVRYFSRKGQTYCLIVGNNTLKVVALGNTEIIDQQIKSFRTLLLESKGIDTYPEEYYSQSSKLYNTLFKPLQKEIGHFKTLIIAPDGLLQLLPFEALCPSEQKDIRHYGQLRYLLDEYEISYTISATVYSELYKFSLVRKQEIESLHFFGIGNPFFGSNETGAFRLGFNQLPGTQMEVTKIASLFGTKQRTLLDKEASEPNLFLDPSLKKYKILHLATHGLIDHENPLRSSLLLAQLSKEEQDSFQKSLTKANLSPTRFSDGLLQVRDIFELYKRISPELVVLSACETGVGKLAGGNGISSLSRAWHFAGAPSVIASYWPVSDQSTAILMESFYQKLIPKKIGNTLIFNPNQKNQALTHAKRRLRHSDDFNAPYYWAPFVLFGIP